MCSQRVTEDELHLLVECDACTHIRQNYSRQLFSLFGGIAGTRRALKSQPSKVAKFMDQDPKYVARFVHECLERRRYTEYDVLPHFSAEDMGGSVAGII